MPPVLLWMDEEPIASPRLVNLDFDNAAARAALETDAAAPLSSLTRAMLLDLLEVFGDVWRWRTETYTTDDIEAAIDAARAELMATTETGGSGAMELIADIALTEDAGGVEFTDIPATFAHLLLLIEARSDNASISDNALVSFNSDEGSSHYISNLSQIQSNAGTITASYQGSLDLGFLAHILTAENSQSNFFGHFAGYILDYANEARAKQVAGWFANRAQSDRYIAGHTETTWTPTGAAIDTIALYPSGGDAFLSGSKFSLYGLE